MRMETTLFEAAVRAAEKANAAKNTMEIAWQTCLTSHTDENEVAFFAANEAWIQSVREWMSAANMAKQAADKKPEQQRPVAGNTLFEASVVTLRVHWHDELVLVANSVSQRRLFSFIFPTKSLPFFR